MNTRSRRRRARGVTLVELMIVVVVVAILGSVAIASYRQSVLRAGRSEAQVALLQQQNNLERCYGRFLTYTPANADDCPTSRDLQGVGIVSAEGRYSVTGVVNAQDYALTATAVTGQGMTDDPKCGTFTIDSVGRRGNGAGVGGAAVPGCWP